MSSCAFPTVQRGRKGVNQLRSDHVGSMLGPRLSSTPKIAGNAISTRGFHGDQTFTQSSTRTTGGDSVEGVDPGGTHSTKPGQADKSTPKQASKKVEQTVQSGDVIAES